MKQGCNKNLYRRAQSELFNCYLGKFVAVVVVDFVTFHRQQKKYYKCSLQHTLHSCIAEGGKSGTSVDDQPYAVKKKGKSPRKTSQSSMNLIVVLYFCFFPESSPK